MVDLKDKVAVITGASSGFGKETAKAFHEAGSRVIITGKNETRLKQAQEELDGVDAVQSDATDPDSWDSLYRYVEKKFGSIDVLVNNAGSGVQVKETTELSIDTIDYILRLNLNSVVYGIRAFGKMMKEKKSGTIINVSSACATEAWPNFSVYAAAKAGVVALSKGCYTELRPFNIRVTALIPGAGRTNFSANAGLPEPETPFSLEPKDVAEAIIHICRMPPHIFIEEYRIWGMDQEVIPL
jgi:NADP-dependent 3-hydroxy acid dehydrogenase YdfG